jgi:hypothetical protein
MNMISFVHVLTSTLWTVWMLTASVLLAFRGFGLEVSLPLFRWILRVLRPFIPAIIVISSLTSLMLYHGFLDRFVALFSVPLNLWLWWIHRSDDDDDRWKKRRKKATEAIRRIGSRLVVASQPG